MLTDEERIGLVDAYLRYLEYGRLPTELPATKDGWKELLRQQDVLTESNPHFEAWEELDYEVGNDPENAWELLLEILRRCHELDLGSIGAGPLETLICHKPTEFIGRFDDRIRSDRRFRDAFTSVRMGGMPLVMQLRLNNALIEAGIDASTLMEFDERIRDDP
jgi:hypothetical protein